VRVRRRAGARASDGTRARLGGHTAFGRRRRHGRRGQSGERTRIPRADEIRRRVLTSTPGGRVPREPRSARTRRLRRDGKYGPFAIARGPRVENIGVEPGQETKLDITLAKKDGAPAPTEPPAGEGDENAPNGYAGSTSVTTEAPTRPDRVPVRDRWRIGFPEYKRYGSFNAGRDIPFRTGSAPNPYDQSILKGDYPIFGQHVFMILSGTSFTAVQQQRTPVPSNVSSARPGSAEFFGKPEVLAFNQVVQFSFEMFSGDSTFKPRSWAIKLSPTFSVPNYVRAREQGVINIDPRRGTSRTDWQFSFEEAFAEVKLEDVNANYDAISARVGIQPFVSDFRGFIYTDNNLGARVFGAFKNNKYQFNLAYFAQLEKDTNSGLNRFDRRRQNVYVANIFKQDFLAKGYTAQASFHFNDDRARLSSTATDSKFARRSSATRGRTR
jgi:hypothetical protein